MVNENPMRPELRYRGSLKHKDWVPGGRFGTLCPEWTHGTADGGFAGDVHRHPWEQTKAWELLNASIQDGSDRRYASERGIAFMAVLSNDGTWHGFPVPWDEVPARIQDELVRKGRVKRSQMRHHRSAQKHEIEWALNNDDG